MQKSLKTLFWSIVVLGLGYGAYWTSYYYQRLFLPIPIGEKEIFFEIPSGSSLASIAIQIKQQGIPIEPTLFMALVRWQQAESKLQAGEYRVIQGVTTPITLLEDMVTGRVVQHAITLVEGWTLAQMLEALQNDPHLQHSPDLKSQIIDLTQPKQPEGLFFPDTYYFTKHSKDLSLLKRIQTAMDKKLHEAWANRSPSHWLQSPYEALILASIVEKETVKKTEYAKIAGVYLNRLQKKMRLQADPTVIYGLGSTYQGKLTKQDLETFSPYNTYLKEGLPPTPICLPSERAILAVMNPESTEALYFVATGEADQGHYFSRTLAEHIQAVARYRKTQLEKAEH